MYNRAIVFSREPEICSLINYYKYSNQYIITAFVFEDEQTDILTKESNIPIIKTTEVDYKGFDTVLTLSKEDLIHPFIKNCIKNGKEILGMENSEEIDYEFLEKIDEDNSIRVPIVIIAGVSRYTEKFLVQLILRDKLIKDGYRVSIIGNRRYGSLFGIHPFPPFMMDAIDNEKRILLFQKYVKMIEENENPELILICIPGGVTPISKRHHFDYGTTAYLVSQAIDPDYVIMNLLYNNYTDEELDEIRKLCLYRFNYKIDCFHLSGTLIDPMSLKESKLKYIRIEKAKRERQVDNLYDLTNPEDADIMYESMIDRLSSYNVNQLL